MKNLKLFNCLNTTILRKLDEAFDFNKITKNRQIINDVNNSVPVLRETNIRHMVETVPITYILTSLNIPIPRGVKNIKIDNKYVL